MPQGRTLDDKITVMNMVHQFDVPSFRDRLIAFLWDYLLIVLYLGTLATVGVGLWLSPVGPVISDMFLNPLAMDTLAFSTTVLPVMLYFAISESSPAGATWGKRRRRLRVTRMDGGRPGFSATILRSAVKFVPWQLAHTCLFNIPGWPLKTDSPPVWVYVGFGLSYALILAYLAALFFGKSRRPLYDLVAKTIVCHAETGKGDFAS